MKRGAKILLTIFTVATGIGLAISFCPSCRQKLGNAMSPQMEKSIAKPIMEDHLRSMESKQREKMLKSYRKMLDEVEINLAGEESAA